VVSDDDELSPSRSPAPITSVASSAPYPQSNGAFAGERVEAVVVLARRCSSTKGSSPRPSASARSLRRPLPVADSVVCACAGLGALAARPFQRAAAFGAGRASAGGCERGRLRGPAIPARSSGTATKRSDAQSSRACTDRARRCGLGAARRPGRAAGRRATARAERAAGRCTGDSRYGPAGLPATRAHRYRNATRPAARPPRNAKGVQVAVAGRVQLGGQVGAQDGERPRARDRPSPPDRCEPAAFRAAIPARSCAQERAPFMAAAAAAPPHPPVRHRGDLVGHVPLGAFLGREHVDVRDPGSPRAAGRLLRDRDEPLAAQSPRLGPRQVGVLRERLAPVTVRRRPTDGTRAPRPCASGTG
jgi:hypothetical protein